jgi:hypothetical protein
MQWYVLERYVDTIGHVTHRAKYDGEAKHDVETTPEAHRGRRPRGRGSFRRGSGRRFNSRGLRGGTATRNVDEDTNAESRYRVYVEHLFNM